MAEHTIKISTKPLRFVFSLLFICYLFNLSFFWMGKHTTLLEFTFVVLRESAVWMGLLESVVVVVVVVVVVGGDSLVLPLALPANALAFELADASTETSAFNFFLDGPSKL